MYVCMCVLPKNIKYSMTIKMNVPFWKSEREREREGMKRMVFEICIQMYFIWKTNFIWYSVYRDSLYGGYAFELHIKWFV